GLTKIDILLKPVLPNLALRSLKLKNSRIEKQSDNQIVSFIIFINSSKLIFLFKKKKITGNRNIKTENNGISKE
ncbi:hypothetical protein, partial [Escherichia coli]|uniref:hypothetical protein n=1 Tax=Escherichia coli TaxID=562 RepID=UPI001E2ED83B